MGKDISDVVIHAKSENGEYGPATRILELLGRHVGAFEKDNKQKGGKVVVNMNFTRPDNPEIQAIIDVTPDKEA